MSNFDGPSLENRIPNEKEVKLSERLKKLIIVLHEQLDHADARYEDLLRVKLESFQVFLREKNDPNNIGAHLMIFGKKNAASIKKMLSEKEGFDVSYSNRSGEVDSGDTKMPNKDIKYLTVKRKENRR